MSGVTTRGDDGFTIVETLVAIALITIGAMMAASFLKSASKVTLGLHTSEQVAGVADGVMESRAALGCTMATTAAMVTAAGSACGQQLGDLTTSVARDNRTYNVALQTAWVAVAQGSDALRLRQTLNVTTTDATGTRTFPAVVTEQPLGGSQASHSGNGTVTVTATAGAKVAMVVGTTLLVHTVQSDGTAVFPYLVTSPATSYYFKLVGSASVTQVDLSAGVITSAITVH